MSREMKYRYTGATYTKPEDMYKCYELMTLINPELTFQDYKTGIDRITSLSNYVQHVILHNGSPVSVIACQDVLTIGLLPRPSCKVNNVATMPEHRGQVTSFLMGHVKAKYEREGYGAIGLNSDKDNTRASKFYSKSGFENPNNSWTMSINKQQRAKL